MQSNNPVFSRAEGFNGQHAHGHANQTYVGNDPAQWNIAQGGYAGQGGQGEYGYAAPPVAQRPMTIDSVVQKTGISLGVVIVTAVITWIMTPAIDSTSALNSIYLAAMVGAGAAFILSMVNSFKRVISPALVLAFCAAEGIALGALSKMFDAQFGDGIVTNAVMGTFAAFAGTLAAYKFLNIKVGDKFRVFVVAAMFGMVGLGLLEMVLRMFGAGMGLFGFGTLGMITAVVGLVLGIFMLILDFDFVEQGIAAGLEERESWRAAFAMTVSLVWIYTNLLRLLAIFSQD
ncbi:Bax inhibitor-1/YccA family membrane protein [Nocardioides sp. Bht2]|uniref:Bax inhibitor-1/YccA family protein n=1 Tax=Nocardioides sp. Bht2 TaxID=3392297 RepID=UPI0039B37A34